MNQHSGIAIWLILSAVAVFIYGLFTAPIVLVLGFLGMLLFAWILHPKKN